MTVFFPRKSLSFTDSHLSLRRVKSGATSPTFRFVLAISGFSCAAANDGTSVSSMLKAPRTMTIRFMRLLLSLIYLERGLAIAVDSGTVFFSTEQLSLVHGAGKPGMR